MRRKINTSIKTILICILCLSLLHTRALADSKYTASDGDGWSMTADGVLTLENDRGWQNYMKIGTEERISKLIIGKDVTSFRIYDLHVEWPSPDFYGPSDIEGYLKNGEPYYDYNLKTSLAPEKIEVEKGNLIFREIDGLLINTVTDELVLAETDLKDVSIPEGVIGITLEAFSGRNIETVKFPTTLKTIGPDAFVNCIALGSVELPDSITSIENGAFSGCTSLTDVILPKGLRTIDMYVFNNCAFQSISIPEGVEEIQSWAFLDCKNLNQVLLPDGLKRIDGRAFLSCGQLTDIQLPEGLEYIGRGSFGLCRQLRRMILPDSLKQAGEDIFPLCDLEILRIPPELEFVQFDRKEMRDEVYPAVKTGKNFGIDSVKTVIFSGSDYDFGYPAIENADTVYFQGEPPKDADRFLDSETTRIVYCADEYLDKWEKAAADTWIAAKLHHMPLAQMNDFVTTEVNATPVATDTPIPSSAPTPSIQPTATPAPTAAPEPAETARTSADTTMFLLAALIALVIAAIVIIALRKRGRMTGNKSRKR